MAELSPERLELIGRKWAEVRSRALLWCERGALSYTVVLPSPIRSPFDVDSGTGLPLEDRLEFNFRKATSWPWSRQLQQPVNVEVVCEGRTIEFALVRAN